MKSALLYAAASLGCIVFTMAYSFAGHGVHSDYMTWMFTIPLAAAVLQFAISGPKARNTFFSAVLTLTFGSCMAGVLQIYGTASILTSFYLVAGITLLLIAVILEFAYRKNE